MFKSISINSDEVLTDFQRVPENLPFAKGVELLKAEREKLAYASSSAPAGAAKIP